MTLMAMVLRLLKIMVQDRRQLGIIIDLPFSDHRLHLPHQETRMIGKRCGDCLVLWTKMVYTSFHMVFRAETEEWHSKRLSN
jgi:hypothetical protein